MEDAMPTERAELGAELARLEVLIRFLFDESSDGIMMLAKDGSSTSNLACARMVGLGGPVPMTQQEWSSAWSLFRSDRKTLLAPDQNAAMRALRGEIVDSELMFAVGPTVPQGVMLSASGRPTPAGAIVLVRDVTARAELEDDLVARNADLAAREQENRELIARLRVALDDLSTPVLELAEDVLALPVIGLVDSQRSAQMSERLLNEVVRARARFVIVDLTGVELVDTATADRLAKLARGVELLGARCVLSGLQPRVAQTLADLDIQMAGFATHGSLRMALEHCLELGAGRTSSA